MDSIRVTTPAKVNYFLRVLGRRTDGYHELETLFQAVGIYDRITFTKSGSPSELRVPNRPELETPENLIIWAIDKLSAIVGKPLFVNVTLEKGIPVGGGLGGGSSDAAAALVALNELYDLKLSRETLHSTACELGADVPFFLHGGAAIGEGIGERLTDTPLPFSYPILLVNPGFQVSTARVFTEFSKTLTGPQKTGRLIDVLKTAKSPSDVLHNDLPAVTERLWPEVAWVRQKLVSLGAEWVLMSGSGPTVFALGEQPLLEHISGLLFDNWYSVITEPIEHGIRFD